MKCFEYKDVSTGEIKTHTLESLKDLLFKKAVVNAKNATASNANTNTPLVSGVTPVIPVITEGGVEVLKTGKVKKTATVVKTPVQKIPSKKKTKNIKASSISDDAELLEMEAELQRLRKLRVESYGLKVAKVGDPLIYLEDFGTPNTHYVVESVDHSKNTTLINATDIKTGIKGRPIEQLIGRLNYDPVKLSENIKTLSEAIKTKRGDSTPTDVSKIYNELGDRTKSNNILINNVYQQAGVKYAKSVDGVFSLRLNNTSNHFGNPFSSVISEFKAGNTLIPTDSTKESVEKYIEWILSETTDINPEQHKFIRTYLQSGALKNKPIVYYKELGEPSHATALDYLINKYDWTKAELPAKLTASAQPSTTPTTSETPQAPSHEAPAPSAKPVRERPASRRGAPSVRADNGIDSPYDAPFSLFTRSTTPVDIQQEAAWLNEVLPGLPVEIRDRLITTPDGMKAEGFYYRGAITLSSLGNKGVAYHEAFHAVMDLFIPAEKKAKILDDIHENPHQAEEILAEMFRAYMIDSESITGKYGYLGKLFMHIRDFVYGILSPIVGDHYTIFAKIRNGAYANTAMVPSISSPKYSTIPSHFTADVLRDVTMALGYTAMTKHFYAPGVQDASYRDKVKGELIEFANDLSAELRGESEDAYDAGDTTLGDLKEKQSSLWYDVLVEMESEDGYDLMAHVDSYLKAMKIEEGKIMLKQEDDAADTANNKTRGAMSSTFEFSTKAGARAEIKLALSMLHVSELSNITGFNKFVAFSEVWSTVSNACIGIGNTSKRSAYEGMVEALTNASAIEGKGYLTQVIDKLTKKDEHNFFRKMFVTTFSGANAQFSISSFSKSDKGRMKDLKYIASSGHASNVHVEKWKTNFEGQLDNNFETGETSVSHFYQKMIINASSAFVALGERVNKRLLEKKPINEDDVHRELSGILSSVGFDISQRAIAHIQKHNRKKYNRISDLFTAQSFGALLNPAGTKTQDKYTLMSLVGVDGAPNPTITSENNPIVQLNKMLRSFARNITQIEHTPGESHVLTGEGIKYTQTQDNLLSKTFALMKADPQGFIDSMRHNGVDTQAIESSVFFKEFVAKTEGRKGQMDESFLDGLDLEVFNTLNVEGSDSNSEYTDMYGFDETVTRVSRLLNPNPSLSGLTFADKKTWYQFRGFSLSKLNLIQTEDGNDTLSVHPNSKAVEAFVGYVKGEHHRAMMMSEYLRSIDGKLPQHEDIMFFNKNCTKFSLFTDLQWREGYTKEIFYGKKKDITPRVLLLRAIYNEAGELRPISYNAEINKLFKDYIVDLMNKKIAKTHERFTTEGIYKALPSGVVNDSRSEYMAAAEYEIYSQQSSIEFAKLFMGDTIFFKNLDDVKKRSVLTTATGVGNDTHDEKNKTFTMATQQDDMMDLRVEDPEGYEGLLVATRLYYESIREEFNLSDEEIEARIADDLSPYTEINTGDGHAWILPSRWEQIMDIHGKLDPSLKGIVKNLKEGKNIGYNEYLTGQPIKGMYGGFTTRVVGGVAYKVPVYLKYSQAVLWPHVVAGNPKLQAIKDKMERAVVVVDGVATSRPVSELVYKSGIKVGAVGIAGVNDEYIPVTLDNNFYKIQQELGAKYAKRGGGSTGRGSQMPKILFLDIDKSNIFDINNEQLTGDDLIKFSAYLDDEISNLGKEKILKKLGLVENKDGTFNYTDGKKKLYDFLLENVKEEATEDIKSALEAKIHLDLLPQYRDKLNSVIASAINKSNVTVDTQGGSFIQMSSVGLGVIGEDELKSTKGIIYFNKGEKPKGPRIVKGKIKSAQVFLPYRPAFDALLKKGLTPAQLKEELMRSGMLDDLLGYRIPTQAQASIDKLEIVGILPKEMGDSVYVYSENPAKTGADFDIDKMYVIMSEYDVNDDGTLRRIPSDRAYLDSLKEKAKLLERDINNTIKYSDSEYIHDGDPESVNISEAKIEKLRAELTETKKEYLRALKNAKLDVFISILSNERMFAGMIQSLDNPLLKRDAAIIKFLKNSYDEMSDKDKDLYNQLSDKDKVDFIEMREEDHVDESLTFTSPYVQQEVKESFGSGQVGIGIWANNSTSHSLFQQTGGIYVLSSRFAVPGLINTVDLGDGLRGIDLCRKHDVNGFKISATITAFMNGSVDIAKGAYIFDVNCNQETSAPIAFLIRAGVDLKIINRIMSNQVVVDYVNAKVRKQSAISPDFRSAEAIALGGKELTQLQKDEYINNPLFAQLTVEKLDEALINPSRGKAQILQMFMELSELATDLSIVSNNFKYDVDGMGGNLLENIVTEDSVNHVLNKKDKKTLFGLEGLMKGSLGTYRRNASEFAQKAFGSDSVTANASAVEIYKTISKDLGHRTLNNTLVKKISKSLYAYALSGSEQLAVDRATVREYTKANKLNELLNSLKEHETNGALDLAGNLILNGFSVITDVDFQTKKAVSMIALSTSKLDKYEKDDYIRSFAELLMHQDPEVREKAELLIKLSFMTSGFGKGLSSYYDKIPFASLMKSSASVESAARGVNINNFLDQFYRNNWHDDKIVPKFSKKYSIKEEETKGVISVTSKTGNSMKPYMKKQHADGNASLYRKIEDIDSAEGTVAVYVLESRLGYNGKRVNVYQYNSSDSLMDGGLYNDKAYDIKGVSKYPRAKVDTSYVTIDPDNRLFNLKGYESVILKAKIMKADKVSVVMANSESVVVIDKIEGAILGTDIVDTVTAAVAQINDMDLDQFQDLLNNKCNL